MIADGDVILNNVEISSDAQYLSQQRICKLFGISHYRFNKVLKRAKDPLSQVTVRTNDHGGISRQSMTYSAVDIANTLGYSSDKYKYLIKEYIVNEFRKI